MVWFLFASRGYFHYKFDFFGKWYDAFVKMVIPNRKKFVFVVNCLLRASRPRLDFQATKKSIRVDGFLCWRRSGDTLRLLAFPTADRRCREMLRCSRLQSPVAFCTRLLRRTPAGFSSPLQSSTKHKKGTIKVPSLCLAEKRGFEPRRRSPDLTI